MTTQYPPLKVARVIPVPRSISEPAQARLAALAEHGMSGRQLPAPEDSKGWEAAAAATDAMLTAMIPPPDAGTTLESLTLGGVPATSIDTHQQRAGRTSLVCFYLHGGALYCGGGEPSMLMGAGFARGAGISTTSVDYRMPPRSPYPAPLDDCVASYRAFLASHDPRDIVVAGESAGCNLAAALVLRARDEGLPMPAAVVLLSPELDLTESGDSFETLMGVDAMLVAPLMPANLLYAAGHDLADPYVSPLFGDLSKGFPPTFLQTGTRDLFLSNAVRFHRALRREGLAAELHVWEAMSHGGFGGAPEDGEVYDEVRRFIAALP